MLDAVWSFFNFSTAIPNNELPLKNKYHQIKLYRFLDLGGVFFYFTIA